ncbi:hypothetical protein SELMODRAFT_134592 [Selaginella moellendorffii]|uniref:DUF1995 domain-containing protein n=1 Tax=Selaginella moellendorffii TaxID=88036 RepID=D8T8W0_SELML|nr:protein LOW PSII ACCUMULATION 3, chloroplastic isoform X2 [Selaginella moellendorffii]EFJ06896.1 hypothetical protein SELMODRAFT_134592 [Selaginella moellendorffii]|eukprot:XP_002992047.1 protein LOW PSII ACCUMULATION 3, chloroplastic isoform X2 [Selaginella moellendorffii]
MLSAPTTAWRICACPLRRCRDLRPRREKLSWRILRASRDGNVGSVPFPSDYIEMVKQAQDACQAALDDSKKLLEVEVPPAGLNTVSGDEEGGIEMNISMEIVQKFCAGMFTGEKAPRTRVFFPELAEMNIAKSGVFDGSMYKLDYLTKPSPWDDIGLGKKVKMSERTRPTDATFVVAYPFFNPNEMLAVEELYRESAKESGCPIIVINGDLDKIRNGYYPPFFYPKLGALAKTFLPDFETVYYIHNFKGRFAGTLFRAYPGPWQVLRSVEGEMVCIHSQETMPSLKTVALEILPFQYGVSERV